MSCVKVRKAGAAKNGFSNGITTGDIKTIQYTVRNQIQRVQSNYNYITSLNQHSTLDHHEIPLKCHQKSPCGGWLKRVKTTNQPFFITTESQNDASIVHGFMVGFFAKRGWRGEDSRDGRGGMIQLHNGKPLVTMMVTLITMLTNGYYGYYGYADGYYGY